MDILYSSIILGKMRIWECLQWQKLVDHSLVYNNPEISLLFFNLTLSFIPALKPSFLIHILFSFLLCFLLLDLTSCRIRNLLSTFPSLWILFFYFWFGMNAKKYQVQIDLVKCLIPHKLIVFCSCGFILFLSLTLYT